MTTQNQSIETRQNYATQKQAVSYSMGIQKMSMKTLKEMFNKDLTHQTTRLKD